MSSATLEKIASKKAKAKQLVTEIERLDKDDQLIIIGGIRSLYLAKLNRESKEDQQEQ